MLEKTHNYRPKSCRSSAPTPSPSGPHLWHPVTTALYMCPKHTLLSPLRKADGKMGKVDVPKCSVNFPLPPFTPFPFMSPIPLTLATTGLDTECTSNRQNPGQITLWWSLGLFRRGNNLSSRGFWSNLHRVYQKTRRRCEMVHSPELVLFLSPLSLCLSCVVKPPLSWSGPLY